MPYCQLVASGPHPNDAGATRQERKDANPTMHWLLIQWYVADVRAPMYQSSGDRRDMGLIDRAVPGSHAMHRVRKITKNFMRRSAALKARIRCQNLKTICEAATI